MSETPAAGGPVTGTDRIAFLDVLRGFAVMAIFIVNVKVMMMPFAYYANPGLWETETDRLIAIIQLFVVDDKWRTTFTALYGAGLFMIWQRLEARGQDRSLLTRRNAFLLLFGAIHLIFIWIGDILTLYALTGFLAMLFVKMGPARQLIFGLIFLTIGVAWVAGFTAFPLLSEELTMKFAGKTWTPDAETLALEIEAMGGSLADQLVFRSTMALAMVIMMVFSGMGLLTLGLMILGMWLFRAGLYQGSWPLRVTLPLAVVTLAAAWWLDWIQVSALLESDFDFVVYSKMGVLKFADGLLGAFGYACLISALVSLGIKFGAVAAVGRMAFTNYIASSLIGTSIAAGHTTGLYGSVTLQFMMIVVGVSLIGMLIWSPLWLKFFRFGPLEWLWRSLVYKQRQPLRREPD